MNLDKWNSVICRGFFFVAFLLVALALVDRSLNFFGYTILSSGYSSGRVLEFAGMMLIVVIALLLRQIREVLKARPAGAAASRGA
jgi:hypothetical protein